MASYELVALLLNGKPLRCRNAGDIEKEIAVDVEQFDVEWPFERVSVFRDLIRTRQNHGSARTAVRIECPAGMPELGAPPFLLPSPHADIPGGRRTIGELEFRAVAVPLLEGLENQIAIAVVVNDVPQADDA